ncbi:MAG: gliding motility-associated C-terminal domain-containing protein [Bacteroidetes bacterium]|nr:gliding motility-associated C-terminal domain-containing protein [Bacteroidota bacterium]
MNYIKSISTAALLAISSVSLAQIVDASPETQTICSGGSANLTAVVTPGGPGSLPTTSYAVSSIGYAPGPYTGGTFVTLTDDSQSGILPIGFTFCFFGNSYTNFYIGSNGWIAFAPTSTTFTSAPIPSVAATVPKNCIMGPWQDWHPGIAGGPYINYQTLGTAPNRRLVVSWNNCPMFSCTTTLGRFQIIIYESTNIIENHIATKPACLAWAGGTAVQGIHNAHGTIAYTVPGRNSTAWTATNEAWRYTPNGVATYTINWYVLPSNTLVGTGSPITVTPPAGQPSTSYYAQITGTSGCGATLASTDTVVVLQTIVPTITAGNNGPICAGTALNLTATPAIPGATYAWTGPGGFTSTLQNPTIGGATPANSGVYTVTPTLAGCLGIASSTTVTVNPTPATPVAAGTTPVCSGTALNLSTTSTGPSWSWTGPGGFTSTLQNPTIASATVGATGTYSVTATSAAGCTSLPGTVNIVVNPTPVAPTVANVTICNGLTATLTASGSGAIYMWYNAPVAGTLLGTGATFTTPPLTTTTSYYVQSNTLGCIGPMSTVTVTVAPSLVVNAGLNDSICAGGNYTLGVTPSGAGYTYSWDAPGTPGFSASATPNVTPATTTTYTVTVSDALGCTGTDVVTITVGTPLTITASGSPANCFGACDGTGTVSAAGSFGGYVYNWSTGATTTSVSSLCANTYTVIVTDLFGCTVQDTIQVIEPTLLTLTGSTITSNCNQPDGSATVVAAGGVGGYTYLWSDGQTTATASNLIPGLYCVTVTDANGCFDSICLTVPNTPGVSATIASTVVTCNGLCDGTATVTASLGVTPYSYLWNSGQTTPGITGLCPGSYTCTITDASGCTITASTTITQPPVILINPIAPVTICIGQSTTLTATATGGHPLGGYTFNWMAPAFTGASNTVSPIVTTTYTVIATDTAGCISQSPQTVTVTVNPALSVVPSANVSICPGASTTLSAVAAGGDGSYTYNWMPGSGAASTFSVSPAATTTYTITVTDGCTTLPATGTITVTVLPVPVVAFSANITSGCEPLCVTFTDASTVAGGTTAAWSWDFDNGSVSTLQAPAPICYNSGLYDITLTVTSSGGCTATSTINNMINVSPQPVAAFIFGPQPTNTANPVISFTDLSSDAVNWSWDFGDAGNLYYPNSSNATNPTHTYADSGMYCVTLIVQSAGGCADSITNCLFIEPEYTFYIPSGFTPNGDGLNPVFAPKGQNIDEFTMRIFDRWGNMIFNSTSVNEGWDGRVQNKTEIAQQDVYVYNIEVKDNLGKKHKYIGTVTIVK